jgi:hypothetical protein
MNIHHSDEPEHRVQVLDERSSGQLWRDLYAAFRRAPDDRGEKRLILGYLQ